MRRTLILLTLLTILAANCSAQQKKRVAVMNFDYGTVRTDVVQVFGGDQDVGKGLADLLVTKLVNDGTYSIIERKELDKVIAEQNLSNSDRADAATAAKIGRVLSVDAIIVGSITQFGRDDKSTTVGGTGMGSAGLGSFSSRFGIGGVQKRAAKGAVGITARLVDTSTAEILAAVEAKGASERSGTSLLGAGGSNGSAGAGMYDMSSSNFGQTLLGEATNQAVASLAIQLEQSARQLPSRTVIVEGLVADVAGKTITLNVGTNAGVKVGDQMQIFRKVRDVQDPATHKVIRSIENKIGEISITEVDELSSSGLFAGSPDPKVGDAVKGQAGSPQAQALPQMAPASGQSPVASGTTAALGPKKPGMVRVGIITPEAQMGQPDNTNIAEPVRTLIVHSLSRPALELTPIALTSPAQVEAEAKQKDCDYVLYSRISQKKAGGMGFLGKAMPMANMVPMVALANGASSMMGAAMAAQASGQATEAAANTAASSVKAKNEVTFEYKLIAPGKDTPILAKVAKAKANADGNDVISPLIQQAAAAIVAEVIKEK